MRMTLVQRGEQFAVKVEHWPCWWAYPKYLDLKDVSMSAKDCTAVFFRDCWGTEEEARAAFAWQHEKEIERLM